MAEQHWYSSENWKMRIKFEDEHKNEVFDEPIHEIKDPRRKK